jgi:hypothetical protein
VNSGRRRGRRRIFERGGSLVFATYGRYCEECDFFQPIAPDQAVTYWRECPRCLFLARLRGADAPPAAQN